MTFSRILNPQFEIFNSRALFGFPDRVSGMVGASPACMHFLILEKNDTILTSGRGGTAADHLIQLPARLASVFVRKTRALPFFRAVGDLPAGSVIQEFLDSFNADFLAMD
jgi:hypothetical protein